MIFAIALHLLAATIWVGGMFFAYMILRPSMSILEPPQRLSLWTQVFKQFFFWVWLAIIVLLASGYWMMFSVLGGFSGSGIYIHIMHGAALVMMLLFLHLFFVPYRRLTQLVSTQEWPAAAKQLNQIRIIVATNLVLGLLIIVIASSGRYW